MSKNIVVCCDGTANQFAEDRTNVVKLHSVLQQNDSQVTSYHPCIGTMEPTGALTPFSRSLFKTLEQAVGWGLDYDIPDAYVFLMQTCPETGSSCSASAAVSTPGALLRPCCTVTGSSGRGTSRWFPTRFA